ncbi:unnamed protein product [Somion occarium]|uniref:Uncharacterized protein n=1 Tax=Somion occarium TaxID=3059160 RepID=A0ABP1DN44_9APHY
MRPGSALFRELDEKLELLQGLDLSDDTHRCTYDEFESLDSHPSTLTLPYEDDFEACDACVYDPVMFSPSSPMRSSFSPAQEHVANSRDKPLPSTPSSSLRRWSPPPPPSTPRLTRSPASSSPSSTRSSIAPYYFTSAPYSPPHSPKQQLTHSVSPSVSSRPPLSHSTFPSISSTLSSLKERESEVRKRSGVFVTDMSGPQAQVITERGHSFVIANRPTRKSSRDALMELADASELTIATTLPRRKPRPTLPMLSTSVSSPQLRTRARLGSAPASPISAVTPSSPDMDYQVGACQQMERSHTFPTAQSFDEAAEAELSSRWSMDSAGPLPASTSSGSRTPVPEPPSSPTKTRKRDRLFSFIPRRNGSKSSPEASPSAHQESKEADPRRDSRRTSRMTSQPFASTLSLATPTIHDNAPYPPIPMSSSFSSTAATSSTSSSVTSLSTPVDSTANLIDPFSASPTCADFSFIPDPAHPTPYDCPDSPTLHPTLPLPSPRTPTASFLIPVRASTNVPFLSALSLRYKLRRKKKLIVSHPTLLPSRQQPEEDLDDERERYAIQKSKQRLYENILQWCESFGTVKNIETKGDGLHVYWKDWESADMVCRIQGQVSIPNIGTVSLSWQYVK